MYRFITHIRTRQSLALLFSLFLLLVVLDELAVAPSQSLESVPEPKVVSILVVETETVNYQPGKKLLGEIVPVKRSLITSQVSGKVIEILPKFQKGVMLAKGTELARIEPLPFELALLNAKADLAEAEVELARIKAQQMSEGIVIQSAKARVATAKKKVAYAQLQLEETTIRMPYSGEVIEIAAHIGEYLTEGSNIATALPQKSREIKVSLSEHDNQFLAAELLNRAIKVSSLDGQYQWRGQIAGITQYAENLQRHMYVKLIEDGGVPPVYGQHVYAHLPITNATKLLSLPESALTPKGEIWWLSGNSRIERHRLNTYFLADNKVFFSEDESQGRQAVVFPNNSLSQGMLISTRRYVHKGGNGETKNKENS